MDEGNRVKYPDALKRQEAKCGVILNGDYAYMYFTSPPPYLALDILRDDGWIYNTDLDQWRYPKDKGSSAFNHAIRVQDAICRKCYLRQANKVRKRLI